MRRLIPILAAAVLASALTAGAIVLPARATEGDRPEFERFEACMRDRGFDLGGPETEVRITPDGVTVNGEEVDAEAYREAQRACGGPPGLRFGLPPRGEVEPELRERLERMRNCMRAEEDV